MQFLRERFQLKSRPRTWLRIFAILVASGAAVLALRGYVFSSVLRASLSTLRGISEFLPQGRPIADDSFGEAAPLFPLWPGELKKNNPNSGQLGEAGGEKAASVEGRAVERRAAAVSQRRLSAMKAASDRPEPKNARASSQLVLRWVEARLVPRSISRPKSGNLPAGIELHGVSALGIGLIDGDRLVRVDGAPVTLRGQVVAAVLAARGREVGTMQAFLVRTTKKGVQEFTITVEQPYMESIADLEQETNDPAEQGEALAVDSMNQAKKGSSQAP